MRSPRKLKPESFALWFVGYVAAAFAGGAAASDLLLFLLLAPVAAAASDYWFTPYLEAVQTWGRSLEPSRRRRLIGLAVMLPLLVIFVIGFATAPR